MKRYVIRIGEQYYTGPGSKPDGPTVEVSFQFARIVSGDNDLTNQMRFLATFKLPFKPEILELPQ